MLSRAALALCLALAAPAGAQPDCTEDAMLVFDGSGSMAEMGYNGLDLPRILEAREAMRKVLPRITPYRRMGLVVYGPGQGDICSNVALHLRPEPDAAERIQTVIDRIEPDGNTALTRAVQQAAEVLDYRRKPGVIVLVTDGKETCGGQACALAADLARDAADLTIHVIGFKVRGQFFDWDRPKDMAPSQADMGELRCLAERTGGSYVSAETVADLVQALQETVGCPLYGALRTP